jgi:hypothetical protein
MSNFILDFWVVDGTASGGEILPAANLQSRIKNLLCSEVKLGEGRGYD